LFYASQSRIQANENIPAGARKSTPQMTEGGISGAVERKAVTKRPRIKPLAANPQAQTAMTREWAIRCEPLSRNRYQLTKHQVREALKRVAAGEPLRETALSYNVDHSYLLAAHDTATVPKSDWPS
jgi:hypothetical protein